MCKKVDEARRRVKDGVVQLNVFQRRPITIVNLVSVVDGKPYMTTEYAKVQWPDWYDKKRGVDVAVGKATKRIAQAIVEGKPLVEGFTKFDDQQTIKGLV